MYVCTTHAKIERVVSAAWVDYATLGSGLTVSTDTLWDTKGDLAAATGPDAAGKLVVGTNGQVLTADSAQTLGVKWAAPAAGAGVAGDTLWDTKGDLAAATGADTAAKLPAGSNNKVLTADSTQTTGLKWQLTKDVEVKIFDDATVITTGTDKLVFCVPASLGGCDLTGIAAFVTTVSSSGLPSVGVKNNTTVHEMLSTNCTIDATETTSYTAATAPVINATFKSVATGDLLSIHVDAAGTGAKGLGVILTFTLP
jgi:hypothetical protein